MNAPSKTAFWAEFDQFVTATGINGNLLDCSRFVFPLKEDLAFPDISQFDRVSFADAVFHCDANLRWFSSDHGLVDVSNSTFLGRFMSGPAPATTGVNAAIRFEGARFRKEAWLSVDPFVFAGKVSLDRAVFEDWSYLLGDWRGRLSADYASFTNLDTMHTCRLRAGGSFRHARFSGRCWMGGLYPDTDQSLDFRDATFDGDIDFGRVLAVECDFTGSRFRGRLSVPQCETSTDLRFSKAVFDAGIDLSRAICKGKADFRWAAFDGKSSFADASFNSLNMSGAVIDGSFDLSRLKVAGACDSILDFSAVDAAKPERVVFTQVNRGTSPLSVRFANTDVRKFVLDDVNWLTGDGVLLLQDERDLLSPERHPHLTNEVVAIAYRRLAENFETVRAHDQLEQCLYRTMEVTRRDRRLPRHRRASLFVYRSLSGYGGSYGTALAWLIGLLLLFGVIYSFSGIEPDAPAAISQEIVAVPTGLHLPAHKTQSAKLFLRGQFHSIEVAAFSRRPRYRPSGNVGRCAELAQMMMIPAQLALLLLAIRRQFKA